MAEPEQEVVPQAVLSPLTRAALFLVVTVDPGGESRVRDLLPELSGLQRAVGFRAQEEQLSCVDRDRLAGLGPAVRRATPRPSCTRSANWPGRSTVRWPRRVTCSSTSGHNGLTCASRWRRRSWIASATR